MNLSNAIALPFKDGSSNFHPPSCSVLKSMQRRRTKSELCAIVVSTCLKKKVVSVRSREGESRVTCFLVSFSDYGPVSP